MLRKIQKNKKVTLALAVGLLVGNGATIDKAYAANTVLGDGAATPGNFGATALGEDASSGENSTAVGKGAKAGYHSTAVGQGATASSMYSTALGKGATASNVDSTAVGYGATASGVDSTAVGYGATASSMYSTALGKGATASGADSTALGQNARARGESSVAIGQYSVAIEDNTVSFGVAPRTYDQNNLQKPLTRRLVNVSDGIADSDVATVGQLKQAVANAGGVSSEDLDKKIDADLNNIATEGRNVITNLADSVDDTAAVSTSDTNLKVTSSKDGNVTTYDVAINRDLDIDSLGIGGKTYISGMGINANSQKITNVANGELSAASTDAVNGSQLHKVSENLQSSINDISKTITDTASSFDTKLEGKANVSLDNITNEGKAVIKALADEVDDTASVKAGSSNTTVSSEKNGNTTEYTVDIAKDLDVNSISAKTVNVGGKTYISETGINANNKKVANVADGKVAKDSKDAVNGGQLYQTEQSITNNFDGKLEGKANVSLDNITGEGESVIKNLADSVDDTAAVKTGDSNLEVTSEKNGNTTEYTVKLSKDLTVDSVTAKAFNVAGKTYISEAGINANSQKVLNVADGSVAEGSKDAVNGGQLYATEQNITNNFDGKLEGKANVSLDNITNEGEAVIRNLADEVDDTASVKAGSSNVTVSSEKNGNTTEYTIDVAKDLDVNSINAKTVNVGGKAYISEVGINANNQKITNVADGKVAKDSKDAVNGGQLYAAITEGVNVAMDGKVAIDLGNITNEGETVIKNLADSVDDTSSVKAGSSNITVSSEKNGNTTEYTVDVAKDLDVNSISTKTVNVGGKTYISETGINANNKKVANVADGKVANGSKDAVNGGQLYQTEQSITNNFDGKLEGKANVSLDNITGEGESVIKNLANSVDDTAAVKTGDSNLEVTSEKNGNATEYTVKLSKDLTVDSVTAKAFNVAGKTYISEAGINANNQKVLNVADGSVAEGSKDAVNGGQIYATEQNITNNFDGKLEGKANVSLDNITNEGEVVIKNLADSVDDTASVKAGSSNITVSSEKNGNTTEYTIDVAKDLDVNSINAKTVNVGGKTYISEVGINANNQKITNVADGKVAKGSKDAVNGGQLYAAITEGVNVAMDGKVAIDLGNITNEGEAVIKNLADSVDDTSSVKAGSSNITVSSEKNGNTTEYTVDVAKDIDVNSINAKIVNVGGKTYISETGINANSKKVANVADGKVANGSKDAVNGGQLYQTEQNITNNFNNKLDGKANVSLDNITNEGQKVITDLADSVDDTSSVKAGSNNITVSSKKNGNTTEYTVDIADDVNVSTVNAKSYAVNGKVFINESGINANSQKITNVADGKVAKGSKDAVNGGQLYDVKSQITDVNASLDSKANISLDNITSEGKKVITDLADSVDDTAEIASEDENIEIESEKDGNTTTYKIKLADNIDVRSFSVNGSVYIDGNGINANSHRIINVANGVDDTDAVNVSQLKNAMKNASSPLAVLYDSNAKDAVTLAGSNGTTITNVKEGELSKASTDAVNGSQLYATNQKVETNAKNISELQEADKLNVKYTDDSQAEIHLGGNGGTRITNVAQAINGTDAVTLDQLNKAISEVEVKGGNDKNAVHYTDDTHKVAKLDGEGGSTLTGVADGEIAEGSQDAVNGSQLYAEQTARKKADKELGQRIDKETEERKTADKELGQRIDKETEERKAADEALSERIGYVSEGDHSFISSTNNVAQNLEALDKAILVKDNGEEITIAPDSSTKVINMAGKGGENRVITGVQTNPDDAASAANVEYVDQQTKEAKDYANGIGAQAAAMATLHPLDWNKNDKVSVSAAVGSYKSDVAGAVGAYYRPDSKTMMSLQGSFGSSNNMLGLGISKQFGKASELEQMSDDQIRDKIEELSESNKVLKDSNEALKDSNKSLRGEVLEVKVNISQLGNHQFTKGNRKFMCGNHS